MKFFQRYNTLNSTMMHRMNFHIVIIYSKATFGFLQRKNLDSLSKYKPFHMMGEMTFLSSIIFSLVVRLHFITDGICHQHLLV